MVSKDADLPSFAQRVRTPAKLLLAVACNIRNDTLVVVFEGRMDEVETAVGKADS